MGGGWNRRTARSDRPLPEEEGIVDAAGRGDDGGEEGEFGIGDAEESGVADEEAFAARVGMGGVGFDFEDGFFAGQESEGECLEAFGLGGLQEAFPHLGVYPEELVPFGKGEGRFDEVGGVLEERNGEVYFGDIGVGLLLDEGLGGDAKVGDPGGAFGEMMGTAAGAEDEGGGIDEGAVVNDTEAVEGPLVVAHPFAAVGFEADAPVADVAVFDPGGQVDGFGNGGVAAPSLAVAVEFGFVESAVIEEDAEVGVAAAAEVVAAGAHAQGEVGVGGDGDAGGEEEDRLAAAGVERGGRGVFFGEDAAEVGGAADEVFGGGESAASLHGEALHVPFVGGATGVVGFVAERYAFDVVEVDEAGKAELVLHGGVVGEVNGAGGEGMFEAPAVSEFDLAEGAAAGAEVVVVGAHADAELVDVGVGEAGEIEVGRLEAIEAPVVVEVEIEADEAVVDAGIVVDGVFLAGGGEAGDDEAVQVPFVG